ncbi:HesB/YadR/YfhF family protein [Bacillus massiliigorillae]|uniref:HesB/YadR/YfhF family protein n=1 Tax=Bacillus massiliigorillae TaxID=1243664 RepID=UPI00039CE3E7|nr:HesB/YadR/YfhF family protein [Bacillus massiliigorillae]
MKIYISEEAAAWYERELDLQKGDNVRFFARYGGVSTVQSGFSLGIQVEEPMTIGASAEKNEIQYYVEERDLWYFDNHDLYVDYNEKQDEPEYSVK